MTMTVQFQRSIVEVLDVCLRHIRLMTVIFSPLRCWLPYFISGNSATTAFSPQSRGVVTHHGAVCSHGSTHSSAVWQTAINVAEGRCVLTAAGLMWVKMTREVKRDLSYWYWQFYCSVLHCNTSVLFGGFAVLTPGLMLVSRLGEINHLAQFSTPRKCLHKEAIVCHLNFCSSSSIPDYSERKDSEFSSSTLIRTTGI